MDPGKCHLICLTLLVEASGKVLFQCNAVPQSLTAFSSQGFALNFHCISSTVRVAQSPSPAAPGLLTYETKSQRFTMTMLSSENRAVAPIAFSTPPTSSMPIPSPDGAGPDGRPRTLQGPSAKEWASHRETIVSLYKQYPLKRVSEIMRRDYGFSARYG